MLFISTILREWKSHPTQGAWIEMIVSKILSLADTMSHPTRGAWIEIDEYTRMEIFTLSHPTRGAWIEIPLKIKKCQK